ARALQKVSIEQFEAWAKRGLSSVQADPRARRSYFSLETRGSYEELHSGMLGLPLDSVQHLLRLYVEALTGREIDIAPLAAVPDASRICGGCTIHLPSLVAEFGDDELDFRLYKVLAAHAAGQIEFGTYDRGTEALQAAYASLRETYAPENADALEAFSQPDEMVGQTFLSVPDVGKKETDRNVCPTDVDYRRALQLFPHPQ